MIRIKNDKIYNLKLRLFSNNSGSALLMTVLVLSAILIISLGTASLISSRVRASHLQENSTKAYYAAESGAERSLWEVRQQGTTIPTADQDDVFSLANLGNNSSYNVNFSRQNITDVFYTSIGAYGDTQRSVEVSFISPCTPDCDGKNCGDSDFCGGLCDGACPVGQTCSNGQCVVAPIAISNCEELQMIGHPELLSQCGANCDYSEYPSNGNYILDQSIDCSATQNGGSIWGANGFLPIPFSASYAIGFSGDFNGNNKKISNLYINRPETDYLGIFGSIRDGSIYDLELFNINETSGHYSGSLIGFAYRSEITNCKSSGVFKGKSAIGGLVGVNDSNSIIKNSYSEVFVTANGVAGGLAGDNQNSSIIQDSSASGNVTALSNPPSTIGGLVGHNGSASEIRRCYSTGDVSGQDMLGGLVGTNVTGALIDNSYAVGSVSGGSKIGGLLGNNNSGNLTNSFSVGSVYGSGSYLGGLIGINNSSIVSSSYWNVETSNQVSGCGSGVCIGATGLTTAQMQVQSNYIGFDFTTPIWKIPVNYYACLNWQTNSCPAPNTIPPAWSCGEALEYDGQSYSTIQISDQCWMAENLNAGTMINAGINPADNGTIEKYCYNDLESNCDSYGGLYRNDEALAYSSTEGTQGICPTGWHIPSDNDWYVLENYLTDAGQSCVASRDNVWDCLTAGKKLRTGESSGFNSLFGGRLVGTTYSLIDSYGYYWSSTVNSATPNNRWVRLLRPAQDGTNRDDFYYANNYSVRCVKD